MIQHRPPRCLSPFPHTTMSSNIDLAKAVGVELDVEPVAWNTRDLLLYAVGIGAKKDDLAMVYELG